MARGKAATKEEGRAMTVEKPEFNQVNVIVSDLRRSMDFYRRLGISLPEPPVDLPGGLYHVTGEAQDGMGVDLDRADFAQFWNRGWAGRTDLVGRVVLGFGLPSREAVDGKYAELTQAGYSGLAAPYDAFWGARYAIVEDPNGIAVGLMSPIDQARRVWPIKGWPG
jgi:catechol 2,3-dioxygenase-like lactoylglutathione lyase family enzyme